MIYFITRADLNQILRFIFTQEIRKHVTPIIPGLFCLCKHSVHTRVNNLFLIEMQNQLKTETRQLYIALNILCIDLRDTNHRQWLL